MKPRIRVFTNRVEFLNPGALPQPLDKIRTSNMSLPRHPVIAKLFRIVSLAENAGYTLEFLGTWEQINNINFKVVEFDHFMGKHPQRKF